MTGNASFVQTNFQGGEWSLSAQGRMDWDDYHSAMNLSLNGIPLVVGGWGRRGGTATLAPTRGGQPAAIRELHFQQENSYDMEFTAGHLRFFTDGHLVLTGDNLTVSNVSTALPAVITTAPHGLVTGDEVEFSYSSLVSPNVTVANMTGRQFKVTVLSSTTFSIADSVSSAGYDGTGATGPFSSLRVRKVWDFETDYSLADLSHLRIVQNENVCLVLHQNHPPLGVIIDQFGGIQVLDAAFADGPYFDPVVGQTLTASGLTGSVTLTASGAQFAATDVGRQVRMFSEPAAYSAATAYATGDSVKFGDAYYTALAATTGENPTTSFTKWAVNPSAAQWTYAQITAFTSSAVVTATILGRDLLYAAAMTTWRMGLYSATTGYPITGTYLGSRFWLAGTVPNRVDGSKPKTDNNATFIFAPTSEDGTVADDNAIAIILAATDVNTVFWLAPVDRGMLVGTKGGEWLVCASTLNDPITPTDVTANRVTRFRCADIPPLLTPLATVFVQGFNKNLIELTPDGTQGGKYAGANLALKAKHLTTRGIAAVAYQQETTPVIWAVDTAGFLYSCSYKRESPWASQAPTYAGWSQHNFTFSNRLVHDIASGPSPDGTIDALTLVTFSSSPTSYRVETMNKMFEEGDDVQHAFLLDHSKTPTLAFVNLVADAAVSIDLYGLHDLEGEEVTAFVCGVNCGLVTVTNGTVNIPVPTGELTAAYVAEHLVPAATYSSTTYGETYGQGPGSIVGPQPFTAGEVSAFVDDDHAVPYGSVSQPLGTDWEGLRAFCVTGTFDFQISVRAISLVDGSTLASALDSDASGYGQMSFFPDGNLYVMPTGANSTWLRKYNPDTLAFVQMGNNSGSFDTTNGHIASSAGIAYANGGGTNLLMNGHLLVDGGIDSINLDTLLVNHANFYQIGQNLPRIVTCPDDYSKNLVLGTFNATGDKTLPLGVYKIVTDPSNDHVVTSIGTFTYTDIDAGWTAFGDVIGPFYDQLDGNLIIGVTNTDNSECFVAKISATDATVLWTIPVGSFPQTLQPNATSIAAGQFVVIEPQNETAGAFRWHEIDTLAGTVTDTGLVDSVSCEHFAYHDTTGHYIARGAVAPITVDSPTPVHFTPVDGFSGTKWFFLGPTQTVDSFNYVLPAVLGHTFLSKGQILRPVTPAESGARNGPAFGKVRRIHKFAALISYTQDISFGTSFNELEAAEFQLPGGAPYADLQLFSGTYKSTMNDNYNEAASQLCWQSAGPYPATVLAIGGFIATSDE